MESFKHLYLRGLDAVGEMPSWTKDWRWISLYSACIYVVVLGFRLSFAGRWDIPELWVHGERILSTHDSYFWLAKAKGYGLLVGYPLAQFTHYLHGLFGFGFGAIGFWTPAFMGALVGIVCFWWGWLLAGRNAGIVAGLVGSLTPGFFYRTRLGYFDTDMFTLLMPMLIAWLLAYWLSGYIKQGWFVSSQGVSEENNATVFKTFGTIFCFGLLTRFACLWHFDILNVLVLYFFFTVFVLLVNGVPGKRIQGIYGLIVFLLAAFPGVPSSGISLPGFHIYSPYAFTSAISIFSISMSGLLALAAILAHKRRISIVLNPWVCGVCLLIVVVSTGLAQDPIAIVIAKLSDYLNPATIVGNQDTTTILGPIYPSIVQSIIEAKLVPLSEILTRGAFSPWLACFSLIATLVVVALRPVAILLIPLIVLQLASVKLGIRFSMFGGASLIVFLSVGIFWIASVILRNFSRRDLLVFCTQGVVGICFLVFCYSQYVTIPMTPVITKAHAEALVEIGDSVPRESMVWTWWDWGYATQYYAGLETVVDGGNHAGRDVFPVAFAMTTEFPEKTNRMVAFSSQYSSKFPEIDGLFPAENWDGVPRNEIVATLDTQLSRRDYPIVAPQYFVVTWKDLTISKWITYFGNWNLETGKTRESTVRLYNPGELGINLQLGAVQNRSGQGGLVSDIDILDWGKVTSRHYGMNAISMKLVPETPYLAINKVTRQSLLNDRIGYKSMMYRLLTGDPEDPEISKYFKLVVDKLPFVRIYEVLQN